MPTRIDTRPIRDHRMLLLATLLLGFGAAMSLGCSKGQSTKMIWGTVTFQGQQVDVGNVRFVPIESTDGPASHASISDGQYKIAARGGVPLGSYRIEVNAQRKTGRKVFGKVAGEMGPVDELTGVGPPKYTGAESTIIVDVKDDCDGRIDIDIPVQ